jgi:hypothetical protein
MPDAEGILAKTGLRLLPTARRLRVLRGARQRLGRLRSLMATVFVVPGYLEVGSFYVVTSCWKYRLVACGQKSAIKYALCRAHHCSDLGTRPPVAMIIHVCPVSKSIRSIHVQWGLL